MRLVILFLLFFPLSVAAQTGSQEHRFTPVEEVPEFPGGSDNLLKFIASHTVYPVYCKDHDIEGKVEVQFMIDTSGQVTNVKVVQAVDTLLDAEAIRVVSEMPNWKPGSQMGKKVNVYYTVPFTFQLGGTVTDTQTDPTKIYTDVDLLPSFIHGRDALNRYIAENTKYPAECRDKHIEGTVYVRFVIDAEGHISDAKPLWKADPLLDAEAMRVVNNMPAWTPAIKYTTPVKTYDTLPIRFELPGSDTSGRKIFSKADKMPEFAHGSDKGLLSYISRHIKYPAYCIDKHIEGAVQVQCVIDADGHVTNAKVIHSIHAQLDEEALRIVCGMPDWKPGEQNGNKVSVYCTIPVNFKLK